MAVKTPAPASVTEQVKPGKQRWAVFGAAWIVMFFVATVGIFSVISPSLRDTNGWTSEETVMAYSLYILTMTVVGIFSGRFADRYGTVPLMYAGGTLFGIGWFLTGSVTTPGMLYLCFGLVAGIGCGMVYNPTLSTALKWFPDMRGKASGMLLTGAAIGPAVMSPVMASLVDSHSATFALRCAGTASLVAILLAGWLIKSPPAAAGATSAAGATPAAAGATSAAAGATSAAAGATSAAAGAKSSAAGTKTPQVVAEPGQFNWTQMIKTPVFWAMLAIFTCATTAGSMLVTSLSAIAQYQVGAAGSMTAVAFGALAVSISTISNFVGRLSFGVIFDKIGGYLSLVFSLALTLVAMLLMSMATNIVLFVACVVMLGCAFGATLVIFPPLTGKEFGANNLGLNYGIMFLGYAAGGFVGPRLTASFFSETSGYRDAYFGAVILAAIGIALAIVLHLRDKKRVAAGI